MPTKLSGANSSRMLKTWLVVMPPGSGVPVPGAKTGLRQSISRLRCSGE
jgi:hypothetical protein